MNSDPPQPFRLRSDDDRPAVPPPAAPPAPAERVEAREPGSVIAVAFDSPLYREFDYALPPQWVGKVAPGQRVEVPFGKGNKPQVGFCVGIPTEWRTPKLKQILDVVDEVPLIDPPLFELARWISEYYVSPIGRTLATMVPSAVKRQIGMAQRTMVHLAVAPEQVEAKLAESRKSAKRQAIAKALVDANALTPDTAIEIDTLAKLAGCAKAPILHLIEKGVAAGVVQDYLPGQPPPPAELLEPDFQLNDLQSAALEKLGPKVDEPAFSVTLLHGVTSSGKTEIYLRLIRRALARGRQVLVLIPEIALTTQAVDRYRKRLGSVAVIHSGLNDTQRHLAWARIARGDYQVVLGTLSGVFAPCPRLGLIVVDEEQESSFKHLKSPRYSARDVAIKRGQLLGIPVILGSATPSLESWHNAQHLQRYEYLELPRRVSDVPMPKVRVVDMHEEARARHGIHLLSRLLEQQIQLAVDGKRQVVLLLNRRGYASYLFCQSCQFVMDCERCNVHLTYHRALDVGLCHQCGRKVSVPANCPSCGHKLIRFGLGTQRIEEELNRKFPSLRYARVDSDTMRHARDYERVLSQFEQGELDLLLGTQMIAKGLDFPNVRLVGVVSADTTLAIPDFRSAERTFQLVSQVAGRAGRSGEGGEGRVVIQTLHAALPAITFAVKHDYRGFAEHELPARKELGYPPFGRMALFVLRHRDREKVLLAADELAKKLTEIRAAAGLPGRILGPGPAPIERIRDQFRFHVLLQSPRADLMQRWLAEARRQGALDLAVEWVVDVDPLAVM
ncbi:MAG: primosomal protein N' [Phycisphaerae bacterium]|nr:primosomal protein N' [Phycisphaerae bacterium]